MIRPSSLPMLQVSPCFEGEPSDFSEAGQDRHAALHAHLQGDDSLLNLLDEEEFEAVQWAADYIKLHAPTSDYPLRLECHVDPLGPDFQPLFKNGGTADAICGPELFDLKWRRRDHAAQLAAYALELFDEFDTVRCHVLFGAEKKAEVFRLDFETACDIVFPIIANARYAEAHPEIRKPGEFCGWCEKKLTCPALTGTAHTVALGYADPGLLETVDNWHPSKMESPEQLAVALTIARRILGPWIKSVEFHAVEAAVKKGLKLPGYELKDTRGKKYVTDVARAHECLDLTPLEFLSCCALRLNGSKQYPDRKGIFDVFSKKEGLKRAPAKRRVEKLLLEVIKATKPGVKLVAVGNAEETEEDETE